MCVWIALEPTFSKLLVRMGEPDRPGILGALNGYPLRPTLPCFLWFLMIVIHSSSTSSSDSLEIKPCSARELGTACLKNHSDLPIIEKGRAPSSAGEITCALRLHCLDIALLAPASARM